MSAWLYSGKCSSLGVGGGGQALWPSVRPPARIQLREHSGYCHTEGVEGSGATEPSHLPLSSSLLLLSQFVGSQLGLCVHLGAHSSKKPLLSRTCMENSLQRALGPEEIMAGGERKEKVASSE